MSAIKLKWKVGEAPTGRFRSFYGRAWPMAYVGDKCAAYIICSDDYSAKVVKECSHAPLKVQIADYRRESNTNGGAFRWRTLKGEHTSLDSAKKAAQDFLSQYPNFLEA